VYDESDKQDFNRHEGYVTYEIEKDMVIVPEKQVMDKID
jgi:hypothetical protein